MSNNENMITWGNDEERMEAFASHTDNVDAYGGLSKSK